jgi:hypothetical protein
VSNWDCEENFHYEIKNDKLRKLVEKKAKEKNLSVDQVIWNSINIGLMGDNIDEDVFKRFHSKEYLKMVNEALGLD